MANGVQEFLDEFYLAQTLDARVVMLSREPRTFRNETYNAMAGGLGEYLYKRWTPDHPPAWIGAPGRFLERPFFPSGPTTRGMREYLIWSSPPEFKCRNVMTGPRPFRRASQRGRESIYG